MTGVEINEQGHVPKEILPCRSVGLEKPLTRCYEGVNFSAGCRRGHIPNTVMSLSTTR